MDRVVRNLTADAASQGGGAPEGIAASGKGFRQSLEVMMSSCGMAAHHPELDCYNIVGTLAASFGQMEAGFMRKNRSRDGISRHAMWIDPNVTKIGFDRED